MRENNEPGYDGSTEEPESDKEINGTFSKSAKIKAYGEATDDDMKKINKFSMKSLKAEDVFIFKLYAADNETDDRNSEPFDLKALQDMKKLYPGRPVIKDHWRKSDNQIARVFDSEVDPSTKTTNAGEVFSTLYLKCYMMRTDTNKDLITDIEAGIKSECSTSCRPKAAICNICGVDNMKTYCSHYWGKEYDTANGKQSCHFTLSGVKDVYEVSLVAVPAQPRAGTSKAKAFGSEPLKEKAKEPEQENMDSLKDSEINLRLKAAESFLFTTNQEYMEGEKYE